MLLLDQSTNSVSLTGVGNLSATDLRLEIVMQIKGVNGLAQSDAAIEVCAAASFDFAGGGAGTLQSGMRFESMRSEPLVPRE
jgi:hypothetical protein